MSGKGLFGCILRLRLGFHLGACIPTWPSGLERQAPFFHRSFWLGLDYAWHDLDVHTIESLMASAKEHERAIRGTCGIRRSMLPMFLFHIIRNTVTLLQTQGAFHVNPLYKHNLVTRSLPRGRPPFSLLSRCSPCILPSSSLPF